MEIFSYDDCEQERTSKMNANSGDDARMHIIATDEQEYQRTVKVFKMKIEEGLQKCKAQLEDDGDKEEEAEDDAEEDKEVDEEERFSPWRTYQL